MKVKFFAYIRDYTKTKEITIAHYKTLEELLLKLCEMYGKQFKNKVFKNAQLSDEVIILVNGRNIFHLQGLKTPLSPKDEISIFPVVAGG